MTDNRKYADFIRKLILLVIAGGLFAVMLAVIIDPYRIYDVIDIPGFNHVKPKPERYQEEIKLKGVQRTHADTIILGNSRAEIGFNPDDKILYGSGRSIYNLAIAGTGIETTRRQLDYLHQTDQNPKLIILGLDFLDFLADKNASQVAHAETKNSPTVDGYKWQFDAAFSLPSVADAMKTVKIQRSIEAETMTSRGFNPLLEYNKYAREQGYYALFQQRAEENAKNFIRKRHYVVLPNGSESKELRSIIATASEANAELQVVIYPYHAQILQMFEQLGLWPEFEQWKALLAIELNAAKVRRPQFVVQLWDFSGYSPFQCEVIPSKMDKITATKWYWEGGHFKPSLGSIMLARILEKSDRPATGTLGYPLSLNNLEANIQRITQEKSACMSAYPGLFTDVARLINEKQPKY